MDYTDVLRIAEKKLGIDFPSVILDIKDWISRGATGGEISGMVGKYLKDLEINNKQAYNILKNDIDKYLLALRKSGMDIL